jgi:hypothetical protein
VRGRVDTKWRFQFFAKYDYCFLLDVIIAIIATLFVKAKSLFCNYRRVFRLSDNRDYRNNRNYHLCEIDLDNPWSFEETRFAKHFAKQRVVSLVSLFFRGDRGT